MKSLNTKGLIKQIKNSKKSLVWSLKDGVNAITDKHWLINFTEIPTEIRIALFSIFAQFPEEGTHLRYDLFSDQILAGKSIDFSSILADASEGNVAMGTNFSYDIFGIKARVFRQGGTFSYVNENYLLAVQDYDGEILMSGAMCPIYFKDAGYITLPYRMSNEPEKEILELFTK